MEGTSTSVPAADSPSFLLRHQFLIYRLFSLAGVVPVGGYMVIHLLTNATVLNGVATFQENVDRIHSLGVVLPLVEWIFIFLPLLFHAFVGWLIISGAVPNTGSYPYSGNIRYVLQRATGMVAFLFIFFHVMQLHHMGKFLLGGQFDPEHAASSASAAIDRAMWIKVLYAVGVLACVYHLANGIWTAGITWGVWVTSAAQRRASYVVAVFGVLLAFVGLSALWGITAVDQPKAVQIEDRMQRAREIYEGRSDVPPAGERPSGGASLPPARRDATANHAASNSAVVRTDASISH